MTPTVSVALCTYNGARYIEEQLLSILNQTLPVAEIVLSDDGSTDDTLAIARRTLQDARQLSLGPAIRLRVLENGSPLGVARNFEQALRACTGDFIALCDQDDIWHSSRLERLTHGFAGRADVLLMHSDAALVAEDGSALGITLLEALEVTPGEIQEIHSGRGFDALLRRNLVTGATTMVRGELVQRATPFPESWIHDEWMAMIAGASARFDLIEEPLTDYRQHDGNHIGARKLNLRDKVRMLREPRLERNTNLVARAIALVATLEALGDAVPPENLAKALEKLAHERLRFALPVSRIKRIVPVLREASRGRYSRFSRGRADILRDLVQPA